MSLLRNVVLEPSSHTQTKTVFRIPSAGKLLMPDIRLCNFGVSAKQNGTDLETYNYAQGIYSLIKAVRLYSNNILIDQCQDCSRYLPLQNLSGSTEAVYDIKQKTVCSNVNLNTSLVDKVVGLKERTTNLLGLLSLKACLPVLSSLEMLYNMPGELRVEIEYNTAKELIFSNDGNGRGANFSFTVSQPTCLYTQEMNEEVVAKAASEAPKKFMWFTWEREYIQSMPMNVNNTPRVRAFDNKFVDVLVTQVIREPQISHPKLGYGKSDALQNQRLNYVVNGSKLMMFNGQDLAARRVAGVVDSLGDLVVPFNAWDNSVANADDTMSKDLVALGGSLSWSCVSLGRVINRLDLEFYFSGIAPANDVDLWVWGRILKVATMDAKGNWVVGYGGNGSAM